MARIRSIKPEFFRDETLVDLEKDHPELRPMLVFAGLWGHCDRQGVFEWKPRQLALDILPFLWRDTSGTHLGESLVLLADAGRVVRYERDGKSYGYVPTFLEHQRITGKEGQAEPKYPPPPHLQRKHYRESGAGHNGDTTGCVTESQEGKGREREREREGNRKGNGKSVAYSSEFEAFWKAYPPRANSGSKSKASKLWEKSCEEVTADLLIAKAFEYRMWCDQTGNTGGHYVKMATTWLNEKGWEAELRIDTLSDPDRKLLKTVADLSGIDLATAYR